MWPSRSGGPMERSVVRTENAASPGAHYSLAVRCGHLLYTAGCVGVDPATGELEPGGFEAQTRRTLSNIASILEAGGSGLEHVIKATCFVKHMEDFVIFDRIYREYFVADPPARTTIVTNLVREEFLVEVEVVSLVPGGSL